MTEDRLIQLTAGFFGLTVTALTALRYAAWLAEHNLRKHGAPR